jgi:hypothetical protein
MYTAFGTFEEFSNPKTMSCPKGSAMVDGAKCASCPPAYTFEDQKCKKVTVAPKTGGCPAGTAAGAGGCVSSKISVPPTLAPATACECPAGFDMAKDEKGADVCVQQCSAAGPGNWVYARDRNVCTRKESVERASEAPIGGRRCQRGWVLDKQQETCFKNCDLGWDPVGKSCVKVTEAPLAPRSYPVCALSTAVPKAKTVGPQPQSGPRKPSARTL